MSDAARQRLRDWGADTAIVIGSGLAGIVGVVDEARQVAYGEFPALPAPSVAGHFARFVLGAVGEQRVIYAQGRVHLYEGYSAAAVTAAVRLLAECGVTRLILTNAAGATNPQFKPGCWMMMTDHINLTGATPLIGSAGFVDMTDTYTPGWRAEFARAARDSEIALHEGVYAGLAGPQYETPAEVRMLQHLGADAVGMSTVLEAIQARALGMQVAGFSCLTNYAAGISGAKLSHPEVLARGQAAAGEFARLLAAAFATS